MPLPPPAPSPKVGSSHRAAAGASDCGKDPPLPELAKGSQVAWVWYGHPNVRPHVWCSSHGSEELLWMVCFCLDAIRGFWLPLLRQCLHKYHRNRHSPPIPLKFSSGSRGRLNHLDWPRVQCWCLPRSTLDSRGDTFFPPTALSPTPTITLVIRLPPPLPPPPIALQMASAT